MTFALVGPVIKHYARIVEGGVGTLRGTNLLPEEGTYLEAVE